jgi:hypothetical protein
MRSLSLKNKKQLQLVLSFFALFCLAFVLTGQTSYADPFNDCLSKTTYCSVTCNDGTTVIFNSVDEFQKASKGQATIDPSTVCSGSAGSGGVKSATPIKSDAKGGGPRTQVIPPGGSAKNLGDVGTGTPNSTVQKAAATPVTSATPNNTSPASGTVNLGDSAGTYSCGGGNSVIHTSINFGCSQKGNALLDLIFGIIRFLSAGVGIVVIGSIVFAGVQYTVSRGDPNATAAAVKRIQNTGIALLVYIFAFAILNYIVPAALLK